MAIFISDNNTIKWNHNGIHYCLHIHSDDEPCDPRKDYDNTATMACWHRQYSLGDDIGKATPEEFWQGLVRDNLSEDEILTALKAGKARGIRIEQVGDDLYNVYESYMNIEGEKEGLVYEGIPECNLVPYLLDDLEVADCTQLLDDNLVWLPLWLYDHSGITMSCGKRIYPYSDRWDSSCVGFIVMTKETAFKELAATEGNWREKAIAVMEAEVETYDQYLRGEVYGYTLYEESANGEWTEIDSCWSFFGDDLLENGILDDCPGLHEAINSCDYEKGTAELHTTSWYTF